MPRIGRLAVIALALVAIFAIAAPRFLKRGADKPAAAASRGGRSKPLVVVHIAVRAPLVERLVTTGTLRANEQIQLTTEIAGQVQAVNFREGAVVGRGAVLLVLEDRELAAQRDRARHRVELAQTKEERQRRLVTGGLVSQQEYDVARGELDVLKAELQVVEAQLAKTRVRAPFRGVVGLRQVSPGAYVTPQTRIATLQDLDPMKVDFTVPERYVDRVRAGQRVELRIGGSEVVYGATIDAVEPAVDADTRSLVVRASLANPSHRLRPGAFAEVSVIVAESPQALTVPSVAVVPELGGRRVLVVRDGVAVARPIETGIRNDTQVEVLSGIEAGDKVIVGGLERVTDGDSVTIQETK